MNLYYLVLIRVIIIGFHVWWLFKFTNLRSHDRSIKFRFDLISWLRLGVMMALNLSILFIPAKNMNIVYGFIVGNVMIAVTYFQLHSIMLFGDRYMFYKESGFEMRDVDKFKPEGLKLHMRIKGQAISFYRPITNIEFGVERFSGRRPRRRK